MANVAETLRAMADDARMFDCVIRINTDEIAACESGARCYEIVARLAEHFSFNATDDSYNFRKLIIEARALVTGQEGS